mgnify:CR=1 FL=1
MRTDRFQQCLGDLLHIGRIIASAGKRNRTEPCLAQRLNAACIRAKADTALLGNAIREQPLYVRLIQRRGREYARARGHALHFPYSQPLLARQWRGGIKPEAPAPGADPVCAVSAAPFRRPIREGERQAYSCGMRLVGVMRCALANHPRPAG